MKHWDYLSQATRRRRMRSPGVGICSPNIRRSLHGCKPREIVSSLVVCQHLQTFPICPIPCRSSRKPCAFTHQCMRPPGERSLLCDLEDIVSRKARQSLLVLIPYIGERNSFLIQSVLIRSVLRLSRSRLFRATPILPLG
jgi:hypothetical protein